MKGAPRSTQFDDIYFSAEDGLAETQHVFLNGNNLPNAWVGRDNFVVAETGFGTGLNFFSAWKLFEETATNNQNLDFISIEKFPLTPQEIKSALQPWADYFGDHINMLCDQYPIRVAGFHRIKINSQITLTLIFDDIAAALPQIDAEIDAWFLDGFTPAKNPDMWNDTLYQHMARLGHAETSYATFSAAGDVRRGLEAAGFSVQKQKGFGRKRDMIAGHYIKGNPRQIFSRPKNIAIIGGGLAGTSCAYVLKQYGFHPVIYEATDRLAFGASGNSIGLYNPRFSKLRDALSDFFVPAYAQIIRTAQQAGSDIDYTPCGALHLVNNAEKEERFKGMIQNWRWHNDHIQFLDKEAASHMAGITLNYGALYLPDAGALSPEKLCAFYAQDCDVKYNTKITDITMLQADAVILANGSAAQNIVNQDWLKIDSVRGQISKIKSTPQTKNLKCNIHYGGYMSACRDDCHVIGATFEKWVDHTNVTEEGHAHNIETLKKNIPHMADADFDVMEGRASMRAATADRFPLVGEIPGYDHLYMSAAFGSHGIVGSIAAAHLLADILRSGPKSLGQDTVNALKPQRFLERFKKKA